MYESYSARDGDEFVPDPSVLKKLRLRIEADEQCSAQKKLKLCGRDLTELPPEVFDITELEVLLVQHLRPELSVGWVDPRVGLGWVGNGSKICVLVGWVGSWV